MVTMLQSKKQSLRLRRAMLANIGVFLNMLLCLLAVFLGYSALDYERVFILSLGVWLGHGCLVLLIVFNLNLKFNDASLTLPQMLWVIVSLSLTMFYLQDIRSLMLMGFLLVMSFGAFRLTLKEFFWVTLFTIACYLSSLYAVYVYRPNEIHVSQELFIFIGFVVSLIGFAFMGVELSNLRSALSTRHKELKSAFSRIEELSITDELTGLFNRRYLMRVLNKHRALANRSDYNFVVCYLDLDHFKKVNDQFGHPYGDKVLVAFSRLVNTCLREVDIAARIGGEEFVLVLANTQLDAAHRVCQRISDKWFEKTSQNDPFLPLTLSTGIAEFKFTETIEETLERADALLYEAKSSGRNCIVVEQQEQQVPFDFEAKAVR
jgi:diguanylate cyclase (GGDEF)-like protein